MIDWLIVGAGFTGVTLAERIATCRGERVLVIDRRSHVGGNAYDHPNEDGILVHKYGPHIFHTNSEKVWNYLRNFASWRPYFHRVRAVVDGREVPIPFNLDTIAAVFPPGLAARYTDALLNRFRFGERVPILKLMKEEDGELKDLAAYVYERVFRNYTYKQWNLLPEELSPSVTARVPILVSRDDRYFQDKYQAMPEGGYTRMFMRMLDHPRIKIMLQTDYAEVRDLFPHARVIYTGPIDEYFDYCYGALPYRSLRFRFETLPVERHQAVGTVNYPEEYEFTRITELKHLTGQSMPRSTLVYEYPEAYEPARNEPYYPIPRDENQILLQRYQDRAARQEQVIFCGRLADYKYYNMDQAVGAALALFEKRVKT